VAGGYANSVGWDLIGYPGLRMVVTEGEQRMGERAKPVRQSASHQELEGDSGRLMRDGVSASCILTASL
jgi:hypothetical protein